VARTLYYNLADDSQLPQDAPPDAVRAEFARRLQRAMIDKNWSQSELARRAAKFTVARGAARGDREPAI
jgi:hypothetical protein